MRRIKEESIKINKRPMANIRRLIELLDEDKIFMQTCPFLGLFVTNINVDYII